MLLSTKRNEHIMFDDFESDYDSHVDYMREAYGDPCPSCGTLRGGGDCGKCDAAYYDEQPAHEYDSAYLDAIAARNTVSPLDIENDDIPF
jgi:hypothetical protein